MSGKSLDLLRNGPTLPVHIGFHPTYRLGSSAIDADVLSALFEPCSALIDTGASVSCIDDDLARKLELPAVAVRTIAGVTGAATYFEYSAQIFVPELSKLVYGEVVGVNLAEIDRAYRVLLGRDFLQYCRMVYDGIAGEVSLTDYSLPEN